MNGLADIPALYWQILGALCGLALGVGLGAIRLRRQRNGGGKARPSDRGAAVGSSAHVSRLPEAGARAASTSRSKSPGPTGAPVPRRINAEREASAPVVVPSPVSVGGADSASTTASAEALAALQALNAELQAQVKSLQTAQAQEVQERQVLLQTERRRYESALEHIRQEHSAELSRLMSTMVEQVDTLHQSYGVRIKSLEQEVERWRGASPDAH